MLKPSKSSFSCKLNKKYKDALKWKLEKIEITDEELADYYRYKNVKTMLLDNNNISSWRSMYLKEMSNWEDDEYYSEESTLQCCGINELIVGDTVNKDTPKNRYILAKKIANLNNDDNRVFFTGLPISKMNNNSSNYNFKNYRVIRKIFLDFGMKQVTPRPYTNNNSQNRLSVLVGQF